MKIVRENLKTGSILSFAEVMIIQQAIDAAMIQGADQAPVKQPSSNSVLGWLRADYQDDNRGLRGNAPLFVLGKKDPSTVWGLDYIPLTSNSPVIPDGWVACSERMPEDGEKVLTSFRGGMRTAVCKVVDVLGHKIFVDELTLFNGVPADHWQPLPAAPQQEADNE
ncbi:TPA: DUF551 domain-containing protein [Enterobacter hormaechei]|nr:DUF551 domain-containing protein [Enterobacter hormaechei]